MIYGVYADSTTFRSVEFQPGFNAVLAERTDESTRKDSRNGLGKTTLIEILHFCLGASAPRNQGLLRDPLMDWTFSIDLELRGQRHVVRRNTSKPARIVIEGDCASWPIPPRRDKQSGEQWLSQREWNEVLGVLMFDLPLSAEEERYAPTFRSLISYFIRKNRDAFSTPFEHHRKQLEWDKQVNNAFLLGLSWRQAQRWQILKDQEKALSQLRDAARSGVVAQLFGSIGELETQKVQLETQLTRAREQLESFVVHPQYRTIEEQADHLTADIHELVNENVSDRRMVTFYETSLQDEQAPTEDRVAAVYAEAGLVLPGQVAKRLEDVHEFHHKIIINRRVFLAGEVERLRAAVSRRDEEIRRLTEERARLMKILQTQGALEEYVRLQERQAQLSAQLEEVRSRIDNLRQFEERRSALRIEQEQLRLSARADFEERRATRDVAIALFNANSEALYEAPGRLIIDIGATGFKFQVDIERSTSQGIEQMKVFCYDIMLAQLWSKRGSRPGFLVHDSTIFDGVDERQIARALELAANAAQTYGFQYICCLNSDMVPWDEFSSNFNLRDYTRLELTDARPDGGLLGVRF